VRDMARDIGQGEILRGRGLIEIGLDREIGR